MYALQLPIDNIRYVLGSFDSIATSKSKCFYCLFSSILFHFKNKTSTNVQECIQLFMSKEELDGNEKPVDSKINGYLFLLITSVQMCAKCKQKRRCTKKFSIQKCPQILVLHLKRFSQSRTRAKLNTDVDFPLADLRLDKLVDVMSESYEGSFNFNLKICPFNSIFRANTML